jgi:hypothetical protein
MAFKDTDKILVNRDGVDYQADIAPLIGGGGGSDSGIEEAPKDGEAYIRQSEDWKQLTHTAEPSNEVKGLMLEVIDVERYGVWGCSADEIVLANNYFIVLKETGDEQAFDVPKYGYITIDGCRFQVSKIEEFNTLYKKYSHYGWCGGASNIPAAQEVVQVFNDATPDIQPPPTVYRSFPEAKTDGNMYVRKDADWFRLEEIDKNDLVYKSRTYAQDIASTLTFGAFSPEGPGVHIYPKGEIVTREDSTFRSVTVGQGKYHDRGEMLNTAVGLSVLQADINEGDNTAVGANALNKCESFHNTGVGSSVLSKCTQGRNNVAIGSQALSNVTTGIGNIGIGFTCGTDNGFYRPVFDPKTEDNRLVMGHDEITHAYVQVAWTVTSDKRDKMNFAPVPYGLDFVNQLKPTAYQFKVDRDTETPNGDVRYGFLAQEILALEGDNPVIIDTEDADNLKYKGEHLVPVLVNAVQELTAMVKELQTEIAALKGA